MANPPTPPKSSGHKYDAILALDPAGSQNCGLALRRTKGLENVKHGKLGAPDWYHTGSCWNQTMYDELSHELVRIVPRGGKVLLVAENAAYGGPKIVKSLGECIGAVQNFLGSLNVWESKDDTLGVHPTSWRRSVLPGALLAVKDVPDKRKRRLMMKQYAVSAVQALWNIETDDNAAEAMLMLAFVAYERQDAWAGKL